MSKTPENVWMTRVISLIRQFSSWRSYAIITILFLFSFIAATGRPYGTQELSDITGGLAVPDLSIGYTPQSVYSLLDAFGQAGRDLYLSRILPLDIVFSLCYLFFFAITLSLLIRYLFPGRDDLQGLLIIPVIGGIADIVENFCFIGVLLAYPDQHPVIITCASVCTKLKFVSNISAMLLIIVALITAALSARKRLIVRKNGNL
ncbi:hypothetical protein [uncultured Methanospirillum sp.]|uniref:hypothetical protein n=1 Tax=uncultured Methanospirillum sp. TaxID=262503 RepID=UPI0029C8FBC4|nr:hypothetical protein [uncultured Methanospirillum sp.]